MVGTQRGLGMGLVIGLMIIWCGLWVVGDDNSKRFWIDLWLEGGPLRNRFRRSFDLSENHLVLAA